MELAELSEIELEIIQARSEGRTEGETARNLTHKERFGKFTEEKVGWAAGQIYKKLGISSMPAIVYLAIRGGVIFGPGHTTPSRPVSERERLVANLLKYGSTNMEIGARLGRSEKTIKRQIQDLFEIYNARSRSHLIALMLKDGIIE